MAHQNKIKDSDILRALVNQVSKAANGGNETEVVTYITKPMWKRFLKACGLSVLLEPSEWNGEKTIRVFGSHTIIIDSKELKSVSFKIESTLKRK